MRHATSLLIAALSLLAACSPNEDCGFSPPEPILIYESVEVSGEFANGAYAQRDSAVVSFTFQDGDGNLEPAQEGSGENLFAQVERRQGGAFVSVEAFGLAFEMPASGESAIEGESYRIADFTFCGTSETGTGVLLAHFSLDEAPYSIGDTLRIAITAEDRVGNRSNTILSDPFVVGQDGF